MKQKETETVKQFTERFRSTLALISDEFSDKDLESRYRRGLHPLVQTFLAVKEVESLEAAILAAEELDDTLRHYGTGALLPSGRNGAKDGPVPMDLSHSEVTESTFRDRKRFPRMTADVRKYCRQTGSCFRCRKPGHVTAKCPSRAPKADDDEKSSKK